MYSIDIDIDVLSSLIAEFFVIFVFIALITSIFVLLTIGGVWKVLKKGNKPGWGALVPIYNVYLLCQMVGINTWWILIIILSPILCEIPIIGEFAELILVLYFVIIFNISLARAFNKEDAFAIGLILLAPVFYLILGFEKESQYVGAKPMRDVIFEYLKINNNSTVNETQYEDTKGYCPSCGTKIEKGAKYCRNCGKQI